MKAQDWIALGNTSLTRSLCSLTQPRPGKTWKSALKRLRLAAYHPPTAQLALGAAGARATTLRVKVRGDGSAKSTQS